MGDFAQSGAICTLQNLGGGINLEADLRALAAERPIALILPCHARDFGEPALRRIRDELWEADWLSEIVFALNGLTEETYQEAVHFFKGLPARVRVLWVNRPDIQESIARILGCPPAAVPQGKGVNVWVALGLLHATTAPAIIALQDCDVMTFQRSALARLCFPCAEPELNFSLTKMYYPRVTDRLYGRVSRLFLAPLLRAFITVARHEPLLSFLESFRYPLAGELALRSTLARKLSLPSGWGLEIGTLCEVFREVDPHVICQVDGGDAYDHKHHLDTETLTGMCRAIAETLLTQLAAAGAECDAGARMNLRAAYLEESQEAVRRYAALARINELPFDAHSEESLARLFAGALAYHESPSEVRLPAWDGVLSDRAADIRALVAALES